MKLVINCPSGRVRSMFVNDAIRVENIKRFLEEWEGIPSKQQVLLHAGRELKDHLDVQEYNLDEYALSDEVVVYLRARLASPIKIILRAAAGQVPQSMEVVESATSLAEVMGLLSSRGFACSFMPGCPVVAKRQDGTTIQEQLLESDTLDTACSKLQRREGTVPECLTFQQAADGALHLFMHPAKQLRSNDFPVYSRSGMPQCQMARKLLVDTTPLPALAKELCVMP